MHLLLGDTYVLVSSLPCLALTLVQAIANRFATRAELEIVRAAARVTHIRLARVFVRQRARIERTAHHTLASGQRLGHARTAGGQIEGRERIVLGAAIVDYLRGGTQ